MDINLTGKRAVVCGASKGMGRATAVELASLGASVTLIARRGDVLEQVKAGLDTAKGQKHHVLAADMSDVKALKEKITAHVAAQGPFHILVNNTGGPAAGPAHLAAVEDFERAFTQHLLASHVMVQAVIDGMKAEKYGRIINVISTSVKQPIKGLGVSNTIRAAVANWAKTLAGELGPFGITVNNILPGPIDTDRMKEIVEGKAQKTGKSIEELVAEERAAVPVGRYGKPEEIAQTIAFLASPAAAYINGINLPVDGGRTSSL
jgi:3-oxoacyl-[acyl-carrier protein] reductase